MNRRPSENGLQGRKVSFMAQFRGRNIIQIQDDAPSSCAELVDLLAGLNVRDGLRALGNVFAKVDAAPNKYVMLNGVLVPTYAIPPLALELVLASDDTKRGQIDEVYLSRLVRCLHGIPWPEPEGDSLTETLLRTGEAQFSFQKQDPYKWERTVRVFQEIWPTMPQAKSLDLQQVTKATFGTGLDETLILGFVFWAQALKQGWVCQRNIEGTGKDHVVARLFTNSAQALFLQSLSIGYDDIRRRAGANPPEELRKFRFNPLALYPLVLPDEQPSGSPGIVYLVPCAKFLLDRITEGLIYDWRRRFDKAFNDAFGHVIERYVGDLLIEAYGEQSVRDDFEYRVNGRKFRSPDWAIWGSGCAVVIEVKKTLVQRRVGGSGSLAEVRESLQNTLQKAVNQLVGFRAHLHALGEFPSKSDVEFVVTAWDDVWWANSILMHQVQGIPEGLHIHVISVRELEMLLAQCESPNALYQTLRGKHYAGVDGAEMDMADWLARLPGGGLEKRPLASLTRVHEDFLARWGLHRKLEEEQR